MNYTLEQEMMAIALLAQNAIDQIDEALIEKQLQKYLKKQAIWFTKRAEPIANFMAEFILPESKHQFFDGMMEFEEEKPNLTDNLNLILVIYENSVHKDVKRHTTKLKKVIQDMLKRKSELPTPTLNADAIADKLLSKIIINVKDE